MDKGLTSNGSQDSTPPCPTTRATRIVCPGKQCTTPRRNGSLQSSRKGLTSCLLLPIMAKTIDTATRYHAQLMKLSRLDPRQSKWDGNKNQIPLARNVEKRSVPSTRQTEVAYVAPVLAFPISSHLSVS